MKITVVGTTGHAYSMRRYLDGIAIALSKHADVSVLTCRRVDNPLFQLLHKYVFFCLKTLNIPSGEKRLLISERYSYLLPFTGFSKSAVVCHDLHTLYPEQSAGRLSKWFYRKQIGLMSKAGLTVCVSENTRNDLLRLFPNYPKDKVKVVYDGLEDFWFHKSNYDGQMDYENLFNEKKVILSVGTDAWYKNFDLSLSILNSLNESYAMLRIGPMTARSKQFIRENDLGQKIIQKLDVSDDALKYAYENAHCLLFPSKSEGFGWPVVEAMASECPVITSGQASIAELMGDPVNFCDSLEDYISIIGALSDSVMRDGMIEKGVVRAKLFSWENAANNLTGHLIKL